MEKGILKVTNASWEQEVLQADRLVLVFFWADWCEPCLRFMPIIKELAAEYAEKLKVVTVNIDENAAIASQYKISIVPTVMMFKHRQKLHQSICLEPKSRLQTAIESF